MNNFTWIITGVKLTDPKRLVNSVNGNPRFSVNIFRDSEYLGRYMTSSDSACNYDVMNYVRSQDRVTVVLTRAGRIRVISREESTK